MEYLKYIHSKNLGPEFEPSSPLDPSRKKKKIDYYFHFKKFRFLFCVLHMNIATQGSQVFPLPPHSIMMNYELIFHCDILAILFQDFWNGTIWVAEYLNSYLYFYFVLLQSFVLRWIIWTQAGAIKQYTADALQICASNCDQ